MDQALVGSICFAPLALMLPAIFFLYDSHKTHMRGNALQKFEWGCNLILLGLGAFFTVAGTYGTVLSIKDAYADGQIGGAFSCANNAA